MRIAIIDSETTGLDLDDQPIIIGALIVALDRHGRGVVIDEWSGEQAPTVPISDSAFAVHGRTSDSLAGKSFDLDDLAKAMDGCTVAIAHHAPFDAGMVAKAWPGIVALESLEWRCTHAQWPFPTDTEGGSLDALCRHFGVQRPVPHDALGDARSLLAVLNQRDPASDQTYLSRLLARPAFVEAHLAAKAAAEPAASAPGLAVVKAAETGVRKDATAQNPPEGGSVLADDEELIGFGVDRLKFWSKRENYQGLPLPIVQFHWFHAETLDTQPLGTYFPLCMQLNDIAAHHNGRCVLQAHGNVAENEWLADALKYRDDDLFAKFVGKADDILDFEIVKRKRVVVPAPVQPPEPPPLDPAKPQLAIGWFDNSILARAPAGTEFGLVLKGDHAICGYFNGKVAIMGDAKVAANQWIVEDLKSGSRLSAVISGKPDGFVDFTVRRHTPSAT